MSCLSRPIFKGMQQSNHSPAAAPPLLQIRSQDCLWQRGCAPRGARAQGRRSRCCRARPTGPRRCPPPLLLGHRAVAAHGPALHPGHASKPQS